MTTPRLVPQESDPVREVAFRMAAMRLAIEQAKFHLSADRVDAAKRALATADDIR